MSRNIQKHLMAKIKWYREGIIQLEDLIAEDPSEEYKQQLEITKDYLEMAEQELEEII
jgi:hypothetical protein